VQTSPPFPLDFVIMESWEGECDFAYLDETYQFNDTLDIDANVASKEIKRKFRFPSQDPSENVIVDDREDFL
jgi:hypothetical protein